MLLKIGSWNINGWHTITKQQLRLVETAECDFLTLQEVTEESYKALVQSNLYTNSEFSLRLRPPKVSEGKGRRLGCAIFCNHKIISSQLLEEAPLPERILICSIECENQALTVCSFHAPPGASWEEIKPQTFKHLANWLTQHDQRTWVGMDANAPKTDHPVHGQNEWWWDDEPLLLGVDTVHKLKDVFRTYLTAHSPLAKEISSLRPDGPLATSYRRGRGQYSVPCRYDFIYATSDFKVLNIEYLYDESITAGSDHALVIAELELHN